MKRVSVQDDMKKISVQEWTKKKKKLKQKQQA